MGGISDRFDQELFDLKMSEMFPQMYGLAIDDTRLKQALALQDSEKDEATGSIEIQLLDRDFVLLRQQLGVTDRIAREVWRAQGEVMTPDFVKEILVPKAIRLIDGWLQEHSYHSTARDTQDPYPAYFRQVAVVEVPKLRKKLNIRYEIEARELEHQIAVVEKQAKPSAYEWKALHAEFQALAEEERIECGQTQDRFLRAYYDHNEHPEILHQSGKSGQGIFCLLETPESGLWMISHGVSENFQERFRTVATRAGVALGAPKGADAEDFWLHRLYLDLMEHNSEQLFAASKEGGIILRICVASATFCTRLVRTALSEWKLETNMAWTPESINESKTAKKAIGRNIDLLRKECGWSFDKLSEKTGIDKKLILAHVNKGAKPSPRILREYSQAFSAALGRTISPLDLEKHP